jgi:hypothetical protein
MYQVIENLKNGRLKVTRIPDPVVRPGHILISNAFSVISAGAEEIVIELPGDLSWVLRMF